jgi:glyoxylase-like metal-dependent hydrolase (beta-lactamase superfamily II)
LAGRTALHLLSDGNVKSDGGALFGQFPKSQWNEWLVADRRNRVRLALNCLLVSVDGQNFLVDTGAGQKHSAAMRDAYGIGTSQLLQALKNHGLQRQDIHGVILTSLHFLHAGGCTKRDRSGTLVPTFPKAKYYVQRAAFLEAMNPNERGADSYRLEDFLPIQERGQLELVNETAELAAGLQVRLTGGPCHGHQMAIVTHGGERVAFLGDLVPTPYHLQLSCIAATDRLPEETLERKREFLAEATRDGWLLVFCHGITERAGYLESRNGRRHLRMVELQ